MSTEEKKGKEQDQKNADSKIVPPSVQDEIKLITNADKTDDEKVIKFNRDAGRDNDEKR